MSNIKVLSIDYIKFDTTTLQGKRQDIERFLKEGFHINESQSRNGYWVLYRPANILVTIDDSSHKKGRYMKKEVCEYYGRERISEGLTDRFRDDIYNGNIIIYKQSDNNYLLE